MVDLEHSVERDGKDGGRKGWTVEEEEKLLELLARFDAVGGLSRRRKGRGKFEPMAERMNDSFHRRNSLRYPYRTWENLRVKANNLRSKYEMVRKRFSLTGNGGVNMAEARKSWPHFDLCFSLFGKEGMNGKEEISVEGEEGDGARSTSEMERSPRRIRSNGYKERNSEGTAPVVVRGSEIQGGHRMIIETMWKVEREREERKRVWDREREERDRKFLLEVERVKMENRQWLQLELERLRQEHTMKLKELEVKLMLVIQPSSSNHTNNNNNIK